MRLSINLAPSRIHSTQHRSHVREEISFKAGLFAPFMNIQAVFFLIRRPIELFVPTCRVDLSSNDRNIHHRGVGHDVGYEVSTRSGKYKSRQTLARFYLSADLKIRDTVVNEAATAWWQDTQRFLVLGTNLTTNLGKLIEKLMKDAKQACMRLPT